MLVLSRRIGEAVIIGKKGDVLDGPIKVQVLNNAGNQVRVGIDAQRGMIVDREEIRARRDSETWEKVES